MKRITGTLAVCAGLLCALGVALAQDRPAKPVRVRPDAEKLSAGNTEFATDMYAQLRQQKGNLFFSPYSISTALAVTWTGASGQTAREMFKVLHLPMGHDTQEEITPWTVQEVAAAYKKLQGQLGSSGKDSKFQLHIANALWGQKGVGLKPDFLKTVEDSFGGDFSGLDYGNEPQARKTINDWVAKQTQDKIKDLIGPKVLNDDTRLVLTNAIYFKAAWLEQFEKAATRKAPFHLAPGKKVEADMMHQSEEYRYAALDGLKVLELPYRGTRVGMLVLLPDKIDGLADVEKSLSPGKLQACMDKLEKRQVDLSLPKFRMTCEFSLKEKLQAMGMKRAFSSADFSGMTSEEKLLISAVLHKAFVDVNEEGTEAAAATAVIMPEEEVIPSKPAEFRADHPFLFLIRDSATGSILFMGRMADPSK